MEFNQKSYVTEKLKGKTNFLLLFLMFIILFSGCKKEEGPTQQISSFENFSFLKNHNPGLDYNIKFDYYGQQIKGRVPYSVDIKNLVASFDHAGTPPMVNNIPQESGQTVNDFSQVLKYDVAYEDGSFEHYEVDITWFTGFPMFHIYTDGSEEIDSKEEYRTGNAILAGGRSFEDGSGDMKIRGRGHSTWYFHPKKPYQLKFDEKTEVFGMPADKKWIFLSEHSDKTLMRNQLAFELGYMSNLDWTPQSVYAEVFVNDDFRGCYNISQKVEESSNRVNIGDDGFLLELDTPDHLEEDDIYFQSNHFTIQIKEPEINSGSSEYEYIKNYIIDFENALYSENFTDPETGYKKYIDPDSFVDWYLINEIAKNQDARDYSSMYCHLEPGKKLKMGPIWDFDLGFGNVNYSDCEYPLGYWVKYHAWITRMFEDPEFVAKVKERFSYFKANEQYFLEFIDNTASNLKYSQQENDERWEVYGNWIWPNPVVFDTHQEEVEYLKDWFERRMKWLDEVYSSL